MKTIEIVKKMIDNNQFEPDVILSILESFEKDIAMIPLLLLKGQKIIRSRINDKKDLFYKVSDLSYPPAHCVTRTDRASLKGHPMFYASVFTKDAEKTGALPRIISAMETLNMLKEVHTYQQCIFTQSVWRVNKDIRLFAFPISEKYKRSCCELSMFREGWETYCKNHFSEKSIEFFSFVGDLMATPGSSCIYEVTATCINYIICNFGIEGIAYPSVPSEGEGLNICLIPETVDEKVKFEGAVTETVIKKGMESTINSFAHAQMTSPTSFNWKVTEYGKKLMETTGSYPCFKENDIVILTPEYKIEQESNQIIPHLPLKCLLQVS